MHIQDRLSTIVVDCSFLRPGRAIDEQGSVRQKVLHVYQTPDSAAPDPAIISRRLTNHRLPQHIVINVHNCDDPVTILLPTNC